MARDRTAPGLAGEAASLLIPARCEEEFVSPSNASFGTRGDDGLPVTRRDVGWTRVSVVSRVGRVLAAVAAVAAADADGVDSFVEAGMVPGRNAQTAASGGARYCRKDTWLLSCLFYKADINDELTDWRSVKAECDREPLCDGVNKYWTSDLWHISSSGEAPGCDESLMDGYGTDASAFYKEGSPGWNAYTADNSCHEVDEWGNPLP